MVDDVILNKCATLERCIKRVEEEYRNAGEHFDTDFTRQDAAVLNIQRACEASLDIGSRDIFTLLRITNGLMGSWQRP